MANLVLVERWKRDNLTETFKNLIEDARLTDPFMQTTDTAAFIHEFCKHLQFSAFYSGQEFMMAKAYVVEHAEELHVQVVRRVQKGR